MAGKLIIWEAANLFAGDDGPNNSKHLSLQSVKLPDMREKTQDHHAGGAIGAINIGGLGLEALELTFKVVGSDSDSKAQFGLGAAQARPYTIYGVMRDKQTGAAIERKAVVIGCLQEVSEEEFSRGNLGAQDHKIGEITHYELYENKQEIYYFDFFASTWRVKGVDQLADTRAILRI